jgi:hypothetical protein
MKCDDEVRQREANIADVVQFALIAHELMHRFQIEYEGKEKFYGKYLTEWAQLVQKFGLGKKAYRCISTELEGHAMQDTVEAFFADKTKRQSFVEACCEDKDFPNADIQKFKQTYFLNLALLNRDCR